jgi:curved DNA-binding protein CbpA
MSNHYETLGVWRDSPTDEIEQRYELLCARLADEPADDQATKRREALDEAHAVLTDPDARAAYDALLKGPAPVELPPQKTDDTPAVETSLDAVPPKARKHVESEIHEGEEVLAVIVGASSQTIVALQTRLFIVKPGFMAGSAFGSRVTSFDYRNITAIEVNKKLVTAVIEVISAGYQGSMATHFFSTKEGVDPYQLSNCLPLNRTQTDAAGRAVALIRQRIGQLQNPTAAQPTSASLADELAKLAELRQQEVLSAEEFDAAKKRLLAS